MTPSGRLDSGDRDLHPFVDLVSTKERWIVSNTVVSAVLGVLAVGVPASAHAHAFGVADGGFANGFAHPLAGLDHVLAMVAVGLWAARLGGRAIALVPAAFVAAMAAGGFAGMAGLAVAHAEAGIALSLVGFGAFVALRRRLPLLVAVLATGAFAVFHGYVHGAEAVGGAAPVLYALGFTAATAALHGWGLGLGLLILRSGRRAPVLMGAGGSGVAAFGLALLLI
jgi:urease accessory protein